MYINTQKNKKELAINNGFSFPCYSSSEAAEYVSHSTFLDSEKNENICYKKSNEYSICVDWVEIILENEKEIPFWNASLSDGVVIERVRSHKNPNFRQLHKIYFEGKEVVELFSQPNNRKHLKNEVSLKIANFLLYTHDFYKVIFKIIDVLELRFIRYARWDIALDGKHVLKTISLLNKFSNSHTVQINNDSITVIPTAFHKKNLEWLSWSIGKNKSGICAKVYDKTQEVGLTKKDYIKDFWLANGVFDDEVGRFEVQLNYKRLKKYDLTIDSLKDLGNAKFISAIFEQEVNTWLKFYQIRKKDFLNHKKEVALKKGKQINYIRWEKLPSDIHLVKYVDCKPHRSIVSARNAISFSLKEILMNPHTSTTAQVDVINKYANDYGLKGFVEAKAKDLFENNLKEPYLDILKSLDCDIELIRNGG